MLSVHFLPSFLLPQAYRSTPKSSAPKKGAHTHAFKACFLGACAFGFALAITACAFGNDAAQQCLNADDSEIKKQACTEALLTPHEPAERALFLMHLAKMQNDDEAIESYEEALTLESTNQKLYEDYALLYLEREDYENALFVATLGIERVPSVALYQLRSQIYKVLLMQDSKNAPALLRRFNQDLHSLRQLESPLQNPPSYIPPRQNPHNQPTPSQVLQNQLLHNQSSHNP